MTLPLDDFDRANAERYDPSFELGPKHRLAINPGPLKLTGPRIKEDYDAGRCKATTRDGLRCLRDAVAGAYCRQHQP